MAEQGVSNIDRAERLILRLMADGEARPGERLKESRIASEHGLPRNVVREALNRLVAGSLVEYVPYSGYSVRRFGVADVIELFELREAVEPLATRALADHHTPEAIDLLTDANRRLQQAVETGDLTGQWDADHHFHCGIVRHSGNSRFIRIYDMFRVEASLMPWSFGHEEALEPARRAEDEDRTLEFHDGILNAIRSHRVEDAQALAAEHVAYAKDCFLRRKLPRLSRSSLLGQEEVAAGQRSLV